MLAKANIILKHCSPLYPEEKGEPFTTCLFLINELKTFVEKQVPFDYERIDWLIEELRYQWHKVIVARKNKMGERIAESLLKSSPAMDEFVAYLDFLSSEGVPEDVLDVEFVNALNSVIQGE